jgi:hypothetical protein
MYEAFVLGLVDQRDRIFVRCLGCGLVTAGDRAEDFLHCAAKTGTQWDVVFVALDRLTGALLGLCCIGQGNSPVGTGVYESGVLWTFCPCKATPRQRFKVSLVVP